MAPEAYLEKFIDGLKKAVADVVTLDVVTLTGKIEFISADDATITDFKKFLEKMKNSTSNIKALAISHYEPDGDAAVFIKDDISPEQAKLLDLHMQTVKSSQEMRTKIIQAVLNLPKLFDLTPS